MSDRLKTYPEYKDSGVPWLGKVPVHWEQVPLFAITRVKNARNRPDLPLLSVYRDYGVIFRDSRDDNYNPKGADLSPYKVVSPGDLVLNKMKTWQGSLGVSEHLGIVSPAYIVCELYGALDRRFIHYLLRAKPYIGHYNQLSFGVRINQWDMRYDDFKRVSSLLPPPEEQTQIARFLDHHDRLTRRYIRAQRRLIELLTEQKQAFIQRAVTRGLDPDVVLKPSGIEWLGEIPAHWEVLPFTKHALETSDYRGATPEKVEAGTFLVTAKNIRMGWIDYETSKEYVRTERYEEIMRRGMPKKGDLLFTTEAPLGNVALVDREGIALAQRIIRFRMDEERLLSKFTLYAMMSSYFQRQLQVRATGSTAQGIKASKLPQLRILSAPIDEQIQIVNSLEYHVQGLECLVDKTVQRIDLIREYRTRLIADVVTGKLDVRDVSLPDLGEVGNLGDLDDLDDLDAEEMNDADD